MTTWTWQPLAEFRGRGIVNNCRKSTGLRQPGEGYCQGSSLESHKCYPWLSPSLLVHALSIEYFHVTFSFGLVRTGSKAKGFFNIFVPFLVPLCVKHVIFLFPYSPLI